MISFRFHLLSLVAVFLALAIGVVVGSTVIDRAIVDGLQAQVDTVSTRLDERQEEVDQLRGDVDRLDGYAERAADFVVEDRLSDDGVVVLAERGVDEDVVRDAVLLLQRAGASAPGVLWLERDWVLDADRAEAVGTALGLRTRDPQRVRRQALAAVAGDLALPPLATASGPPPLEVLVDAGLLEYQPVGDDTGGVAALAGRSRFALVVSGTASELAASSLLTDASAALVATGVRTVVAEDHRESEDGPERGRVTARVLADDRLADTVATVDDLELGEGRVAAVLALDDLRRDVVGNYGYGPGSDAVLPSPATPAAP